MKTCVYDMRTSTGETLSLSLSMSRQYRAKGKYPEAYAACGKVIMGGLDDYMQMAALSELNMHFVNSHFMHPDDLLDEDRGAALGWEKLRARLDEYMTWLDTSAPSLRNLTGSELSGAIQRYGGLTVEKKITDQEIRLQLGNLYDTAYLFVRVNEGTPGDVTGGSLTHLTGKLYLLCADSPEVVIQVEK